MPRPASSSRRTERRAPDHNFLVLFHNLPQDVTWKTLKDATRSKLDDVVKDIGHIDLPRRVGFNGEQETWCSFPRSEYAKACYDLYASSTTVRVHLFETSLKGQGFRPLKCNCSLHFDGVPPGGHSPRRSGINFSEPAQCWYNQGQVQWPQASMVASPGAAAPVATAAPPTPMTAIAMTPSLPAPHMTAVTPTYAYQAYASVYTYSQNYAMYASSPATTAATPIYSPTDTGVPVNIREGAVITEARGVFITGLSFDVGPSELSALLKSVGNPTQQKLIKDHSGRFRGKASAKFATRKEAQEVVARLDNCKHMGKTIKVKLDADATTIVGQIQSPVIVNGSNN